MGNWAHHSQADLKKRNRVKWKRDNEKENMSLTEWTQTCQHLYGRFVMGWADCHTTKYTRLHNITKLTLSKNQYCELRQSFVVCLLIPLSPCLTVIGCMLTYNHTSHRYTNRHTHSYSIMYYMSCLINIAYFMFYFLFYVCLFVYLCWLYVILYLFLYLTFKTCILFL